ncbi:fasciclin domain-containing protein [Mycobacterium sp. 050272]|uniref:fasciclin domain-containing protein n=1 Tax=Mycobacterium sp. 050272 TaxID=3142488 RepID=UPI00318BCCB2
MTNVQVKTVAAASLAAIAIVGFSGCSSNKPAAQSSTSSTVATSSTTAPMTTSAAAADPAADLIGSGCSAYASQNPTGPGSVAGMAQDPVATAASNNPMLTTLTSALSGKLNPQVNLVDTLNNGQYTVFAPTNAAFDKLPAATIDKLKTDAALLKSILTYHVVQGQLSPAKVAGAHVTLQGASATVTGQGNDLKVNDAGLVCGGVHTANATVYMIDTVLMPPNQ